MRLVTIEVDNCKYSGILLADQSIVPLAAFGFNEVIDLINAGPAEWKRVEISHSSVAAKWKVDEVKFLAPIPKTPRNMFCVGVNYKKHFDEGIRPENTAIPQSPVLFSKPWTCLTGHGNNVYIDRSASQKVDWEAELAVVIGLGGINIAVEEAMNHVFGWTLANDVSARDLQLESGMFGQWFKGKSLDGFCPLGRAIVTCAEIPDYQNIDIQLRVNGVIKQSFSAGDMINSVERIISRVSLGQSLIPGDVILTGTSSGVGHWREPPEFLGEGDVVEIESQQLGVLQTVFREVNVPK